MLFGMRKKHVFAAKNPIFAKNSQKCSKMPAFFQKIREHMPYARKHPKMLFFMPAYNMSGNSTTCTFCSKRLEKTYNIIGIC